MNVLVACEESQEVCKAFRAKGHRAFSCDIQECSGGHPEWHIQMDALRLIRPRPAYIFKTQDGQYDAVESWDLIIAHPPCTYLSNAGARWLYAGGKLNEERYKKGIKAKQFFLRFWNCHLPYHTKICIENPVPSSAFNLPKPTQIIQPWMFGEPWSKKTCLWLKGLPPLVPTEIVTEHKPFVSSGSYTKTHDPKYKGASRKGGSAKSRSKTFPGIARAMAEQWG